MGLCRDDADLNAADLILDAMIGYGLVGPPRPPINHWIKKANTSSTKILALDAPIVPRCWHNPGIQTAQNRYRNRRKGEYLQRNLWPGGFMRTRFVCWVSHCTKY
ncbi:MAG: NAD(P)H-hydrate epimerase [Candidatus Helarchaeota archaeon]